MKLPHELFRKRIENRIMSQKLSLFFMLETRDGNYFESGTNHWFTKSECSPSPRDLGPVQFQGNAEFCSWLFTTGCYRLILSQRLSVWNILNFWDAFPLYCATIIYSHFLVKGTEGSLDAYFLLMFPHCHLSPGTCWAVSDYFWRPTLRHNSSWK